MLHPGDIAPDFDLPVLIGGVKKRFKLSDRRGKQSLLVAFYPLNWEPVSTEQMVSYQVEREKIVECGAVLARVQIPRQRRGTICRHMDDRRAKVREHILLEGLARWLSEAVAVGLITFILDRLLRLSLPMRLIVLAAGAIFLAVEAFRYVFNPLRWKMSLVASCSAGNAISRI